MLLTRRQREILCLYSQGLHGPDISRILYVTPRTIDNHMADIKARLGTKSIAHSIVVAVARCELIIRPGIEAAIAPENVAVDEPSVLN